jgi:5-methylcytosine-specific restriction endonuclease McrA
MAGPNHHSGRPWRRLRLWVLERDHWTCQVPHCRYPTRAIPQVPPRPMHPTQASVDLIVPKSLGGNEKDPDNCRAAHLGCNSARGNGTRGNSRYTTTSPRVGGRG